MHLQPTKFQQRLQEHTLGEEESHQQTLLGKIDTHIQRNETTSHSFTIYKYQFKTY